MPVGRPDWYPAGQSDVIASAVDIGELAARLGSIVNFDRSGKVIYSDDFSRYDGLYGGVAVGQSSAPASQTVIAETGGAALSGALLAGITNHHRIQRPTRLWGSNVTGFEVGYYSAVLPNRVEITLIIDDLAGDYWATFKFNGASPKFEYVDSGGNDVIIANAPFTALNQGIFHAIKLDVNPNTHTFRRVRVNHLEYDLSGIAMLRTGDSTAHQLLAMVDIYGHASSVLTWYLDRWIITEDE